MSEHAQLLNPNDSPQLAGAEPVGWAEGRSGTLNRVPYTEERNILNIEIQYFLKPCFRKILTPNL